MSMIELKSMAVAMPEVVGHPNRAAFEGVLTIGRYAFATGTLGRKRAFGSAHEKSGRGCAAFAAGDGVWITRHLSTGTMCGAKWG
jgi:hypothetical protein